MDARRGPPAYVIQRPRRATTQTRFWVATLRAGVDLSASLCRKPLVVNDTTARLASRAASQIDPGAGPYYLRTSSYVSVYRTHPRYACVARSASEFERSEIDIPDAVVDLLQPDALANTCDTDIHPTALPVNAAIGDWSCGASNVCSLGRSQAGLGRKPRFKSRHYSFVRAQRVGRSRAFQWARMNSAIAFSTAPSPRNGAARVDTMST